MTPPVHSNGRSREEGAVALLTAACLTALLVAAAMVLDFGLARLDRQTNKAVADSAALAGSAAMNKEIAKPYPWAGACAAVSFAKAELSRLGNTTFTESWTTGSGAAVSSPCSDPTRLDDLCVPDTVSTWARYRGVVGSPADPRLVLEVKAGYKVTDGGYSEESTYANLANDPGSNIAGEAISGGCDQVAVILTRSRPPGLGSLATSSDVRTTVRSVSRVKPGKEGEVPVAMLILERYDCASIKTTGSTSIHVRGSGIRPGLIHADSLGGPVGTADDCGDKVVGGSGTIKAFRAELGTEPGAVGIRGLMPGEPGAVPANAYDAPPKVEAEGAPGSLPEGRPLVSRAPIDVRYLSPVTSRIATAATKYSWSAATATANGYTVKTTCGGGPGLTAVLTESKVFFDCPGGLNVNTTSSAATSVIVNGPLSIKSGGTLSLPNVTEFLVRGPGNSDHGPSGVGFDNNGSLLLHHNNLASCALADSASSGRAEFVLGSGWFNQTNTGGLLRMCHTTMITAGNSTAMPTYTDPGAEPTDNPRNGFLSINGGTLDWTAPDLKADTPSTPADWAMFEDLAFWTETSAPTSLGGNGAIRLRGTFMLPNANPFSIGGTAAMDLVDSQYIVRKLLAKGGNTLEMRPDPNDAVSVRYFGDYLLVR